MVQCGECGAEYLSALETHQHSNERLIQNTYSQDEDGFQQELEPLGGEEDGGSEKTPPANHDLTRLLTHEHLAICQKIGLSGNGQLDWSGKQGIRVHFRIPEKDGLSCPVCNEKDRPGISLFRPMRLGAPFLLGTAIPALLESLPPITSGQEARPFDGKRLITFTDSRQGTARFASKLQQESERNYVRSLLYHSLAAAVSPVDEGVIEKTQQEIITLEPLSKSNAVIQGLLDQKRQELAKLKTPQPVQLTWEDAENKLLNADDFTRWMLPALNELTYGKLSERQMVKLCLLREFFLRPKRQFSLEGLGLVQLYYPALEKVTLPAVMKQRTVSVDDWQSLLQVAIDYVLRTGGPAVAAPRDIFRWLGYPARPMFMLEAGMAKKKWIQRNWPSTSSLQARRNRLIRLLAYSFKLDLDNREHRAQLEELLIAVWYGIRPLLAQSEDGFQLELEKQAVLREVSKAWFCPVTRRLLPVTFRGITPYLPDVPASDEMALCRKVIMPQVPNPFWLGCLANEAETWLETNQ
ncbi:MAG: hypothetical protein ACXWTR_06550, partial [Methylotenera sp.]